MTKAAPEIAVTGPVAAGCRLAAFAFGGAALALEIQSLIVTTYTWFPNGFAHVLQHAVDGLAPLAFGAVLYRTARAEEPSSVPCLLGAFTAVAVQRSFRGSYLRLGTFDRFEYDMGTWLNPIVAAGAIGLVAALVVRARKGPLPPTRAWTGVALGLGLLLAALGELAFVRLGMEAGSVFAPTRHIALLVLGFAVLLAAALADRVEP